MNTNIANLDLSFFRPNECLILSKVVFLCVSQSLFLSIQQLTLVEERAEFVCLDLHNYSINGPLAAFTAKPLNTQSGFSSLVSCKKLPHLIQHASSGSFALLSPADWCCSQTFIISDGWSYHTQLSERTCILYKSLNVYMLFFTPHFHSVRAMLLS